MCPFPGCDLPGPQKGAGGLDIHLSRHRGWMSPKTYMIVQHPKDDGWAQCTCGAWFKSLERARRHKQLGRCLTRRIRNPLALAYAGERGRAGIIDSRTEESGLGTVSHPPCPGADVSVPEMI